MKAGRVLRVLLALAVVAVAPTVAACGSSTTDVKNLSEGEPVKLGDLQTTVVFSRFLNPSDTEDHNYLVGQAPQTANQLYLGVFVQISNKSNSKSIRVPTGWTITDTQNNTYSPIASNSPYALHVGRYISPEDQAPSLDSSAQVGPIQGSMLLFKIPDSANENRPLRLSVPGPGGPAEVNLDL